MKRNLKQYLCLMLTGHKEVNHTTIVLEGQHFRYHSECRCGRYSSMSIKLHENDLLGDSELSPIRYPVEGLTMYVYDRNSIRHQQSYQYMLMSIFSLTMIVISLIWYAYELIAYGGLQTNSFDTFIGIILSISITMNVDTYLKKRNNTL